MHLATFAALLFAATQLVSGCPPVSRQEDASPDTYPRLEVGEDVPSDPATKGYFINHLCISVRNIDESVDWYSKAFGLRLLFTQRITEHFSITYMGHSAGGRNGTGFQTVEEILREKNNRQGLIEIVSIDGVGWETPLTHNGLNHIGIVVPEINEAQKRFEELGLDIIKPTGDDITVDMHPYVLWKLLPEEEQKQIIETIQTPSKPLLWLRDPSNNIIEVQAAEGFDFVVE